MPSELDTKTDGHYVDIAIINTNTNMSCISRNGQRTIRITTKQGDVLSITLVDEESTKRFIETIAYAPAATVVGAR